MGFEEKVKEFEKWRQENPKMPEKEIIEKAKTMFNIQEETIKVPQDSKQGNSMKIYSKYAKFGTQELKDLDKSMDVDLDKDIEGGKSFRGIAGRTEAEATIIIRNDNGK